VAEKDDYLVDILVDLGFVTADQVSGLRGEASSAGVGVVDLMLANKLVRPADVAQPRRTFRCGGCEFIRPQIERRHHRSRSSRHCQEVPRCSVSRHENTITVAVSDPSTWTRLTACIICFHADIELKVASEEDIEAALNNIWRQVGQRQRRDGQGHPGPDRVDVAVTLPGRVRVQWKPMRRLSNW